MLNKKLYDINNNTLYTNITNIFCINIFYNIKENKAVFT